MENNMKFFIITIVLSLFQTNLVLGQAGNLDISRFGGKPNTDIAKAIVSAFTQACAATTPSKIVIPAGKYIMGSVDLKGPCKAPIELQVDGTVSAPTDAAALKGVEYWFKISHVNSFTLSGVGVFDGLGPTSWKQNDCTKNKDCKMLCMNFGFHFLNDSTIRDVTSKDSKNFHANVLECGNVTFDGFKIIAPAESPNTDGIHIGRSNGVKILNTNIGTGDDCISIGDGTSNVVVQNVNCGPGHGISVGSLGRYENEEPVEGLLVKNCTLKNTDNGVRIKTWPSDLGATVTDMNFEDITMINVSNPIIVDQEYCPWNQCTKEKPSKIKISKVSFKNIKGTSGTKEGMSLICSKGVPCEEVQIANVDLTFNGAETSAKCANVKPIITGKAPVCAA
ncbi:polygalacturonase [Cajanus cajan]|nr:polygalacturonase [Cajanus cajan]